MPLFHVMFNAYWEPLTFELPRPDPGVARRWRRWIDTYRDAPEDIFDEPRPLGGGPELHGARALARGALGRPAGHRDDLAWQHHERRSTPAASHTCSAPRHPATSMW